MLQPAYSGRFKKDFKKIEKAGNKDTQKLKIIASFLCNEQRLPERYRDHALSGDYKGRRECHIEADWLLIYKVDRAVGKVVFERTGSHSELFE